MDSRHALVLPDVFGANLGFLKATLPARRSPPGGAQRRLGECDHVDLVKTTGRSTRNHIIPDRIACVSQWIWPT
jgi:hypothetical protein